jgi:hypothetical protein
VVEEALRKEGERLERLLLVEVETLEQIQVEMELAELQILVVEVEVVIAQTGQVKMVMAALAALES